MLGENLKKLRGKRTQDDIAKAIGISRARYSHYENGIREPDLDTLHRLADYFNATTDQLLGISGDKEPVHREAGISDNDYNNLSAYQKEVIDFFVTREQLSFKNQPENILDALEQFEVFYEVWKKQKDKKK